MAPSFALTRRSSRTAAWLQGWFRDPARCQPGWHDPVPASASDEGGSVNRAVGFARKLLDRMAEIQGVSEFVPIEMAHISSCHYSGQLSLDFAEFLLAEGATLAVPTHTNASLVSASRPDLRHDGGEVDAVNGARRVMAIYEQLGCTPTWTCAPYHEPACRPSLGQHIVGSESNAVSFFNSVLGARTNKYGDVIDMAGAIIGEVPRAGLHTDQGRLATHRFRVELPDGVMIDRSLPHLLGIIVGVARTNFMK